MKMLVALALTGLMAASASNPICLPNVYQLKRSGTYQKWKKGFSGGFNQDQEKYDHNTKEYRFVTSYEGINGEDLFKDMIIKAKEQKAWIITGKRHGGEITCDVKPAHNVNPHPCLLNNATLAGTGLIGGNVYTNVWAESESHVYASLGLTAGTEVPIFARLYIPGDDYANEELYFDYSTQLGADPFKIPEICPTKAEGAPIQQSDLPKNADLMLSIGN